jgi:hypothetical protein
MSWLRRLVEAAAVVVLAAVPTACSPVYVAACQGKLVASTAGPITDPALNEISGIHVGVRNPTVWWVHNDSGDTARVFALDAQGAVRGVYDVAGATAIDWEDLAVVAGPTAGSGVVYAADIGDNPRTRTEIQLYRFTEPAVPTSGTAVTRTVTGEVLRLTYPDGPHDAEAFVVDPLTGDLVVITKSLTGGTVGVYRAPGSLAAGSTTQLTKVGDITYPAGLADAITSADVAADGLTVAVRTYGSVRLYARAKDEPLWTAFSSAACKTSVPSEIQGEAVTFDQDATAFVTVSEGSGQTLHIATRP